jgi:hypothetical protein
MRKTKRSKTKRRNRKHNYLGKARIKYYSIKKSGGGHIYSPRLNSSRTNRRWSSPPETIRGTPRKSHTTHKNAVTFEQAWAEAEKADNIRHAEAKKAEADMRASTAAMKADRKAPIAAQLVARTEQHENKLQAMEARLDDNASMTEERPLVAAMRATTRVNDYKKAVNSSMPLWGGRYGYDEQVKGKGFKTKARRRNGSKKRRMHRKRTASRSRRH